MSVLKGLAARLDTPLEEIVAHSLELSPGKGLYKVLGHTVNGGDVRQVDLCAGGAGKLNLGLLGSLLESLQGHRVLLEVKASVVGGELPCEPLDDHVVEVVSSEVGVSVG